VSLEWTPSVFDALELEPLSSLSPATKLVWCFLAAQGKPVLAGDLMLLERLGLARKAVGDALVRLEALGLLEIVDAGLGSRPRVVQALEPEGLGYEPPFSKERVRHSVESKRIRGLAVLGLEVVEVQSNAWRNTRSNRGFDFKRVHHPICT